MSNGGHVSEGAAETVIVEPASAEAIRSPADVLRLVVAVAVLLVLLGVQWLFGDTLTRFAADLLSGLAAIPVGSSTSSSSGPASSSSLSSAAGSSSRCSGADGASCSRSVPRR